MSFKEDILIFLNNTLIKLERIENTIFKQEEKIKILEAKIKEYELQKEKLDNADKILEDAKNNADYILSTSLDKINK